MTNGIKFRMNRYFELINGKLFFGRTIFRKFKRAKFQTMNRLQLLLIGLLVPILGLAQVKKEALPTLLESKKFVFKATTATPLANADLYQILSQLNNSGGSTIQLNGLDYDLRVFPDSLNTYLPYFGRTFIPANNLNDNGIKFSSTKFTYELIARKKGAWRILIRTMDVKESYRLILEINENGYATLSVRDNYRQAISYYGYIEPNPDK